MSHGHLYTVHLELEAHSKYSHTGILQNVQNIIAELQNVNVVYLKNFECQGELLELWYIVTFDLSSM